MDAYLGGVGDYCMIVLVVKYWTLLDLTYRKVLNIQGGLILYPGSKLGKFQNNVPDMIGQFRPFLLVK